MPESQASGIDSLSWMQHERSARANIDNAWKGASSKNNGISSVLLCTECHVIK